MALTDVVAAGFKTFYLKCISPNPDNKGKGIFYTFFNQMFEGVFELVSDIQSLISGGEDSVDDSTANTIIDTSTNKKYTRTADSSLTVSNQNGSNIVFNMNTSTTVSTITVGLNSTVYNYTSGVTINGSDGNDKIYNFGSNVTINAGKGSDTIYNEGDNVTIKIAGGNNQIYNTGSNVTIEGSEGTDTIESYGDNVTVKDAGGSKNYILVSSNTNSTNHIYLQDTSGGYNTIYGGKGNAYASIAGSSQRNLISVGGGNDTIVTNDEYTTINAGPGNNRVTLKADSNYTKVIGGKGDDLIMMDNSSNYNEVLLYGGVNTVYGGEGRHTITTGDGDDSIVVESGYVNAGDGQNNISLTAGTNSIVITGKDDDTIRVDADKTEEQRHKNYINAGEGTNYIYNSNIELSTIISGKGNDTIITGGGNGYGYSAIGFHDPSINAGDGDNKITVNTAMSNGSILTGTGNDYVTISGKGSGNSISLGSGNDSFVSGITSSNVNMGSGNNSITLKSGGGSNNVVSGDGDDSVIIESRNNNNKISLGSGTNTIYAVDTRQSVISGEGVDSILIGSGYVNAGMAKIISIIVMLNVLLFLLDLVMIQSLQVVEINFMAMDLIEN